ncbi:hypothetical protein M5J20_08975 [Corynebacterium sp. TA-R-1]|uniref:ApeA N-terminal domain-containing protein n=1 Tax=Corynebacterium stercoris TaxID=2943490 RepID=A0ABT1G2W6_9CORY|nr:HEPN domain-containing protein [Corynebacterium stercoris]MCP1388316.1 hypothetical protein [Corynebacterium stercoris]
MNQTGIDQILGGEPVGGFLRLRCGEKVESVPGTIQLIGPQVVVRFTIEEMTRLAATFVPGHMLVFGEEKLNPITYSQTAVFDSSLGSATLIQLGRPEVLTHTITHPLECRLRPRFTVLANVGEPYWRRPTKVMAEIGGLAAWMHNGRVARSGSLNYERKTDGDNRCRLSFDDFDDQLFVFDDSGSTLTIRSLHEINQTDSRDELAIRFRTTVIAERSHETTWTQALDTIDAIQELVNFLSWSNQQWNFLHCMFGVNTTIDEEFWKSIGTPPPPEVPESWKKTLTSQSRDDLQETTKALEFVMPFDELTESSFSTWFQLRSEFAEGLRQILQVIQEPGLTHEVRALQLGAGIELLGFRSLAAKTSTEKADNTRAKRLFNEIAAEAVRLFPETFSNWSQDANNNYQFMKHLGRKGEVPTVGELARTNDLTVLVFQSWLAKRLGASDDNLRAQISESWRFTSDYSRIPDPSELR